MMTPSPTPAMLCAADILVASAKGLHHERADDAGAQDDHDEMLSLAAALRAPAHVAQGRFHLYFDGPPPHVGWWNARIKSVGFQPDLWSWWDGCGWSAFATSWLSPDQAADKAFEPAIIHRGMAIEWTHAWPRNARVHRVNPETGEITGVAGFATSTETSHTTHPIAMRAS